MSASDLADEYDAVMTDDIAVAGGCSQADWALETLTERNAEHARRAAARQRGETVADLKAGSARIKEALGR
jgi:hypothetical protein